jgi:Ca-activated chloride channel family protein
VLAAAVLLAHPHAASRASQFGTSVTLVEVYATVTTPDGRPVVNLTREDFRVAEEGQPREVAAFAAGEFPLSVAMAIDRSWSMAGAPLEQARAAARSFIDELRPSDEVMLIGVSSEVETLSPLSQDRAAHASAASALTPWGSTRLHDAILQAIDRIDAARGRRALVVLSDGQDRGSRATAAEVTERVRHGNVLVYPIVFGPSNSALMTQLAAFSGGHATWIRRSSEIPTVFSDIAHELRHQYLIGYVPVEREGGPDVWRRIKVEVPGRELRVRARPGYYR